MKKLFESSKKGRNRTLSRSRENEVNLEVVFRHKEELLRLLEMEEKRFQVEMERNLVEVEKHKIVLG